MLVKMYVDRVLRGFFDGISAGVNIKLDFDDQLLGRVKRELGNIRQEENRQKQLTTGFKEQRRRNHQQQGQQQQQQQYQQQRAPVSWIDGPPNYSEPCRNGQRGHPCKVFNRGTGKCQFGHLQQPQQQQAYQQQQQQQHKQPFTPRGQGPPQPPPFK
jgi:hypothetical protein